MQHDEEGRTEIRRSTMTNGHLGAPWAFQHITHARLLITPLQSLPASGLWKRRPWNRQYRPWTWTWSGTSCPGVYSGQCRIEQNRHPKSRRCTLRSTADTGALPMRLSSASSCLAARHGSSIPRVPICGDILELPYSRRRSPTVLVWQLRRFSVRSTTTSTNSSAKYLPSSTVHC